MKFYSLGDKAFETVFRFLYRKSVSPEISKCVDFASVQSSKQAIFSLILNRMKKKDSYLTHWHTNSF